MSKLHNKNIMVNSVESLTFRSVPTLTSRGGGGNGGGELSDCTALFTLSSPHLVLFFCFLFKHFIYSGKNIGSWETGLL